MKKFELTEKNRKITTYVLYFLSLVLVFLIFRSINSPIKFNEVKNERYSKVIDRLKDIRNAQIAFKSVNGIYSNDFEEQYKHKFNEKSDIGYVMFCIKQKYESIK